MKKRYEFIAVFNYADDGISIEFPDLPGCLPCADTTDEAIKNAKEAMGLHLFGMEQDGDEIPNPTPLEKIHLKKGDIPILIDVFMPTVRDRMKTRFVKKTLSLPAWLADQADAEGVNFSKVFQNALIEYLDTQSHKTA
ncbi:type II toxin-antitoxin system HicB family antitoxin [uncultured Acetobacterium sp.]|uniref:type II toxin-antitoxin system HicB family antitoxin n=1 Tax=uncultured Acetobacterium sp. TaxID=217139 RepID=UPI0025FE9029|nr:type II toxin-antitoxin system HicB family antitoxin [uncultured Acetobacterium sp.]